MSRSCVERRILLSIGLVLILSEPVFAGEGPVSRTAIPSIGAIRWDGWFKDNPWEKNLQEPQWWERLPFYAKHGDDGKLTICADSQEVMDKEIAYAKAGGIAYWAFCYYHPKSWDQADSYNYGWRRYLASKHKQDVRFCLLLQGGSHLGPPPDWPQTVAQFVALFKEPTYQKVCGRRPLLYVFSCEHIVPHFGSMEAARRAFDLLRAESLKNGVGNPYIVAQIWLHMAEADFLEGLGFEAVGSYSAHGGESDEELPYSRLAEFNRHYWDRLKATGRKVIPLVNAGWDGRPRKYPKAWFASATPAELAENLRNAMAWVRANPDVAEANTILIYAWNEHDEGGWLCPTLSEGSARLDATRAILDAQAR